MLYGADPQGEALEVAALGLRNNCVLDINGGAADKPAASEMQRSDVSGAREQTVPDADTPGTSYQDTENRG